MSALTTYLFYLILFHFIVATPQINLYFTDSVSDNDHYDALQHHCLHTITFLDQSDVSRQIVSFCLTPSPSTFHIEFNEVASTYTFAQLSKQNITSRQLYLWSAPIDIVERYQLHLDQSFISKDQSMADEVFYNCTMPRFGPVCEYELYAYHSNYSSLSEMIDSFYRDYEYAPTSFTCYIHLQCDRGPSPACLDWSEICDGHVDCFDGGFDEEHCWQLEINQCQQDEYRCANGQCIPQLFHQDMAMPSDCLDGSDEFSIYLVPYRTCDTADLSFRCEDIVCTPKVFTSSCVQQREELLLQTMFSIKDNSTSDDCWSAFKCIIPISFHSVEICNDFCRGDECVEIIEDECPEMLYVPSVPIVHNHVHFAYHKNDAKLLNKGISHHPYVCYDHSRYDDYFISGSKVLFNNATCYRNIHQPISSEDTYSWDRSYFEKLYRLLWSYDLISNYTSSLCNRPTMYQCVDSVKCISIHRLNNAINDCPRGDDEKQVSGNNIDSLELLMNIQGWLVDEYEMKLQHARNNISFQTICDGFTELLPITINGRNQTDETDCEQWHCNNIYTRCNHLWNCLDGADEVGCDLSLPIQCSSDEHMCVSPQTNKFMCLPLARANNGIIDCVGASDEPTLCRLEYLTLNYNNFHCTDQSNISSCIHSLTLCDGNRNCYYADDEQFCRMNGTSNSYPGICWGSSLSLVSDVERFLCQRMTMQEKELIVYFSLHGMNKSADNLLKIEFITPDIPISHEHQPRCHRGLDLRIWSNSRNHVSTTTTTTACLCPPSFYGDICQYQNQRVSLAIKFRALSDSWQTPFTIIISLIDDSPERVIHSYEQITYLSMRDCNIKYNLYLLYATRPKDMTKHYFIHIDIYEKLSLTYRGSLLFPIPFLFLPVHRLAYVVDIPRKNDNIQTCLDGRCVHGRCIRYSNKEGERSFCQCHQGWSGKHCTLRHDCLCSSTSICVGRSAHNRSICVCPIDRFGPRCLIETVCQRGNHSMCENNGQCIPADEYMISDEQTFTCICPQGFSGDRCEISDNKLILSFDRDIILSQSIFIHFIEVMQSSPPIRATTFRTIPLHQDSVMIQWSQPFHLVFVELLKKNYYLIVNQQSYNQSTTIIKRIKSEDRCYHLSEVFNASFVHLHLLHRIKSYHLVCDHRSSSLNVSCFYDDIHLCLCYQYNQQQQQQRLANCFEFNHQMTFDCLGQSECENDGECFQDSLHCPQQSMCVCRPCYYGRRCQFNTNGFGLSLDAILGYHIYPHLNITHQPTIVQISVTLTILFLIIGLINGILALMTFKNKTIQQVGCGLYLYTSSIIVLFTMLIFGLKFWILLFTQMALITNRLFLTIQCHSLDFLLRICLNMDQWLSACVAFERALTTKQGMMFNRKKSKQVAKRVIIILLIIIILTSIHDPLHRRLIIEENNDHDHGDDHDHHDEKRYWCIVTYSSHLQIFNSVVYISHFFGPFIINFISAIILITKKSRQQSTLHTHRTYHQLLRDHCRQHKHLFTAPSLLVILALPRLIICFVSKCMKSVNDSWLYLIGYFISFIPSMLTFVIFILPSKFYKKHFRNIVAPSQPNVQRHLQSIA